MTEPVPSPTSVISIGSKLGRFAGDLVRVPYWQMVLLSVSALGAAYPYAAPYLHGSAATQPAGNQPATTQAGPIENLIAHPWVGRAGLSILIGFVVGTAFRVFTKLMVAVAVLFAGLMGTLSYFHLTNNAVTNAATQEYQHATSWLSGQAARWKDAATAHVPSATGGVFGLFLGARKRR